MAVAPTADAGFDQHVDIGDEVTLDGRASSDPRGGAVEYRWHMAYKPAQSDAVLVPSDSPTPSFVADMAGVYLVTLEVTNGKRLSTPDEVVVTAEDPAGSNRPPVAAARACDSPPCELSHVSAGSLRATGSLDPDSDPVTFLWTQVLPGECAIMCPPLSACAPIADVVTWNERAASTAQFAPPYAVGQLVFQLQVSDPYVSSIACAAVGLTNLAPIAYHQGGALPTSVDDLTLLDLPSMTTGDWDLGDVLTYTWTLWRGNAGTGTLVDTATGDVPGVNTVTGVTLTTPDVTGDTAFTLRFLVSDGLIDESAACAAAPPCPASFSADTSCCEIAITVLDVN